VEPNDSYGHQRTIDEAVTRLAVAIGGRMLVLFTSYAQLQKTSKAIQAPLAKHDITVFEQGEGASATALLETFKTTPRAVLLGTRAFWEGVDVPGEALSVLVIAKLPFDVPSDPIIAARSESFDDPFNEYNLPEAILLFSPGLWTPDPHADRPRCSGDSRQARDHQALRQAVHGIAASMYRHPGQHRQPARESRPAGWVYNQMRAFTRSLLRGGFIL